MYVTFFVFAAARRQHAAVGTEWQCQYLGGACVMSGGPFCTPPWLWLYWLYVWGVETGGAPEVGGALTGPEYLRRKKRWLDTPSGKKAKSLNQVTMHHYGLLKSQAWKESQSVTVIKLGLVWPSPLSSRLGSVSPALHYIQNSQVK